MNIAKDRNIDWGLWVPIVILVVMFIGLAALLAWGVTQADAEPTSRCIDAKFRIFERDGDFSVAPDPDCNK